MSTQVEERTFFFYLFKMSNFKPIDGSKEDFRKYLDRQGVLDAITKVLIKCNSDRPGNAIEFILDNLGERLKDKDTITRLEIELSDARNEIELLKQEINTLNDSVTNNSGTGNAVLQSNHSLSAVGDLSNQQDGENDCSTVSSIPSSKGTTETETTKSVSSSETVPAAKTPETAESNPIESTGQ